MATEKKRSEVDFRDALNWSLHLIVEKIDDDLGTPLEDASPSGWAHHYRHSAEGLRAAAVVADKLAELHEARATKAKAE